MAGTDISSLVSTAANNATTNTGTTRGIPSKAMLAQNFDTSVQLLPRQLKNQNPLDPLDTNQFTQQLVQFAQVEQQMNMNTQLTTLVTLQKATQSTQALNFLGATATVDGSKAPFVKIA